MFGLTVLSQALTTAILPLAAGILAPTRFEAAWPYALTFLGAAIAAFPAAALTDSFGRRAVAALGASLGLAGGVIAAHGFAVGRFPELALGAFWLGAAQGFGFFHRHGASSNVMEKRHAAGIVLGAGCVAALIAPAVTIFAQNLAGPLAPAVDVMVAGTLLVAHFAVAIIPDSVDTTAKPRAQTVTPYLPRSQFVFATLAAAAAWFVMARLMAGAAPAMFFCGIGEGAASGLIANHFIWMYAAAALASPIAWRMQARTITNIGLVLIFAALAIFQFAESPATFVALTTLSGAGWSFAMLGAANMLQGAIPKRSLLAVHDFTLFTAAIAGALSGVLTNL